MQAGTETGSLINHVMSISVRGEPAPYVGMGVTLLSWTDRNPGTIVDVLKSGHIIVQCDDYKRIDNNGLSESQQYEYSPNPDAHRMIFKKDRKGIWSEYYLNPVTGRLNKAQGAGLRIGVREKYHDFSF